MQMVCVSPPPEPHAVTSVVDRPLGAREQGQPSRWARSSRKRNRCADIHPTVSSMPSALEMKLDAVIAVVNATSITDKATACFLKTPNPVLPLIWHCWLTGCFS